MIESVDVTITDGESFAGDPVDQAIEIEVPPS